MSSAEEEISSSPSKSNSSKKRVRQRVDAGEPRNSYASIPNFSSRPPLSHSPLAAPFHYSANGYAASKMLADLLGSAANRQQTQEMIVLEGGQQPRNGILNGGGGGRMFLKNDFCEVVERCSSGDSDSSHLLRDILQQGRGGDSHGPRGSSSSPNPEEEKDESPPDNEMSAEGMVSASESPSPCFLQPQADLESKRARVETIVSNMVPKSNGTSHHEQAPPVNGCKKRKLYQPQQHERQEEEQDQDDSVSSPTAAKRRNSGSGSNGGGLFTFRQQLRHMQQQLVAMQQQYMEMVDGDSSDDDDNNNSRHSEPATATDLKQVPKTEVLDYDNASMYDNGEQPRRLVIDDSKEQQHSSKTTECPSADYEWLAESLKAELSTSLSQVVDAVVSRCRKAAALHSKPPSEPPLQQESRDPPLLLSQMLDRKSPRIGGGKVIDRGTRVTTNGGGGYHPPQVEMTPPKQQPFFFPQLKPPASVAATAAFLYGSPPYHSTPSSSPHPPEQTEAMSLVVASKKKRHKVTDTRLRQPLSPPAAPQMYPPPPLVPVTLPTSVAIPNPSLIHQSSAAEIFHHHHSSFEHPFSRLHFLDQQQTTSSSARGGEDDQPTMHPLLTPYHHRGSPDYHSADMSDAGGDSPANYGDNSMAMISFMPSSLHTSTLTPMHLRKAKLMFFFARYPSSAVLKMYFPDIRFNKNNTAQLVKWFSNFREFFYIQMEKYARQAITEGVKSAEDLKVNTDSELLRVLNLHYNRNNHIPSPEQFRYVVEQTLREFYKALVAGKDSEQSWKKSIYKIIARMDDSVPDYFKSPNFLDTLE